MRYYNIAFLSVITLILSFTFQQDRDQRPYQKVKIVITDTILDFPMRGLCYMELKADTSSFVIEDIELSYLLLIKESNDSTIYNGLTSTFNSLREKQIVEFYREKLIKHVRDNKLYYLEYFKDGWRKYGKISFGFPFLVNKSV